MRLHDFLWVTYEQAYCTVRHNVVVAGLQYSRSLCGCYRPTVPTVALFWLLACCIDSRYDLVTSLLCRQSLCFGYLPAVPTVAMFWLQAYCTNSRYVLVTGLLYRQWLCFGYRPIVPTIALRWLQSLLQILRLIRQADYPY